MIVHYFSLVLYQTWNKDKYPCLPYINLLAPEFFLLILAHPVYKMWILQEPNTLELWK